MTLVLEGIVRSGAGDFAHWIELLADHYERLCGMRLFPGTLNVHLVTGEYPFPAEHARRLEKDDYGGEVDVSILPCRIFDRPAFALRTDTDTGKHGDPRDAILEIATDVSLRETHGLRDGDRVRVEVPEAQGRRAQNSLS